MTPKSKSLDIFFWFHFFLISFGLIFRCIFLYPFYYLFRGKKKSHTKTDEPFVIYSQVPWWGVWQRPQEQAMRFSNYHRVVFICPVQIHEILLYYTRWKRRETISSDKGVTVFSPLLFSGHYKNPLVFRLNQWILGAELGRFMKKESSVLFLTNSPFIEPVLHLLPISTLIYDMIDDFASFDWAPGNARELEHKLVEKSDILFTGTFALYEQNKNHGKKVEFIPCGVDFDLFYGKPGEAPEDIRKLPKPIIGYMGTLSDRIDSSLILELAERLKNASIVLIGPVHGSLADPPRAPNIHYIGLKTHKELPDYLHRMKIALLPFRLTKAVQAINPVKTLEYLAAGCVVVSTAIPDVVRFYSDLVVIAGSREDFVNKVEEMLRGDNEDLITKGIERARNSSWDSMIGRMRQIIEEYRSGVKAE